MFREIFQDPKKWDKKRYFHNGNTHRSVSLMGDVISFLATSPKI
jgi:hypothetical protein